MRDIIVQNNPKSPISESYRTLRTNIQFANVDETMRTILVTSTSPGEGKTTTLTNLAAAMAQDGKKVLVIDCDMRKPRIHKVFEISNQKGLSDILMKRCDATDAIVSVKEMGLDVIPAGIIPDNPSELLNSASMRSFIQNVRNIYDYVFVDTPPVIPVTDAMIMSRYIDGVVLVISHGKTQIDMAKNAVEQLRSVKANILGVTLNRIPVTDSKAYYNYYYYADDVKA